MVQDLMIDGWLIVDELNRSPGAVREILMDIWAHGKFVPKLYQKSSPQNKRKTARVYVRTSSTILKMSQSSVS
jgi:hypothetical protein